MWCVCVCDCSSSRSSSPRSLSPPLFFFCVTPPSPPSFFAPPDSSSSLMFMSSLTPPHPLSMCTAKHSFAFFPSSFVPPTPVSTDQLWPGPHVFLFVFFFFGRCGDWLLLKRNRACYVRVCQCVCIYVFHLVLRQLTPTFLKNRGLNICMLIQPWFLCVV